MLTKQSGLFKDYLLQSDCSWLQQGPTARRSKNMTIGSSRSLSTAWPLERCGRRGAGVSCHTQDTWYSIAI